MEQLLLPAMKTTAERKAGWSKPLGFLLGLALLLATPAAKANTYLFSVTGGDILDALETNGSDPDAVAASAYFAVFLRPLGISSFTYTAEYSPNPNSAYTAWDASTITDWADVGPGTYARFSKGEDQTNVAVLSRADGPGHNIFLQYPHSDNSPWPVNWGPTLGTITEIFPETALFQFMIQTNETLVGPILLAGTTSAVVSESTRSAVSPKTTTPVTFSLLETPFLATPEPATYGFGLAGLACLVVVHRLRNKRSSD